MITVQQMMKQMRSTLAGGRPRPFSIVHVTADRTRQTGGEVRELAKAVLLTQKRQSNRQLNVQPVGTKDIIRVHMDLILYFNGTPVL